MHFRPPLGAFFFCALNTAHPLLHFAPSPGPHEPELGSQIHTLQIPLESPIIATRNSNCAPATTTCYPSETPITANQNIQMFDTD